MLLLLRLEVEAAKSLNEGSTADAMPVSRLLSPKTSTSTSEKRGSCWEAESSEKSVT